MSSVTISKWKICTFIFQLFFSTLYNNLTYFSKALSIISILKLQRHIHNVLQAIINY